MKIELELGTNELGHDLVEQFFIWKLRGTIDDMTLYGITKEEFGILYKHAVDL